MSEIVYKKDFSFGQFLTFNGRPHREFFKVKQIHSNKIINFEGQRALELADTEADGLTVLMASKREGSAIPLAVVTADCLPVLVWGKLGYALIHAGWRGLESGILTQPILSKLIPQFAFLGPAISVKNYQVGEEFHQHFPSSSALVKKGDQLYFDLFSHASTQLTKAFSDIQIEQSHQCTFENHNFHSFRRDKTPLRNYHLFIPN